MRLELKLTDLLDCVEDTYEIEGEADRTIMGFASLADAEGSDLSFVQSEKHASAAATTRAGVLIIPRGLRLNLADGITTVAVENPSRAMSQICGRVEQLLFPLPKQGSIHSSAQVSSTAEVSKSATVGAFTTIDDGCRIADKCFIGARVSIGAHCQIGPGVCIADNCVIGPYTEIGEGSRLHSGVVIGSPGFGYVFNSETHAHEPIPQIGRVVIGKFVDIGANSTIDRARLGETQIGDGTKIDNLVQIAHNAKIGRHCILCAFVGISGSVTLGDYVVLAGQVGVADHLQIADHVQVGGGSAVTSSLVEPGMKAWGVPATDFGLAMKMVVLQRKLPELFKRVAHLEKQSQASMPKE